MWSFTYGKDLQEDTCKNTSNTKDQKYQSIIYRSILVTKESNNKHEIIQDKLCGNKINFALMNNERVTTHTLVLHSLLHKTDVLSPIAPTFSSMLTLVN